MKSIELSEELLESFKKFCKAKSEGKYNIISNAARVAYEYDIPNDHYLFIIKNYNRISESYPELIEESEMASVINSPRKVIKVSSEIISSHMWRNKCCMCDKTNMESLYYVAAINGLMCHECYQDWISKDPYLDSCSLTIEEGNFNSVSELLNL